MYFSLDKHKYIIFKVTFKILDWDNKKQKLPEDNEIIQETYPKISFVYDVQHLKKPLKINHTDNIIKKTSKKYIGQ